MMRRVASVDCLIENAFYKETILALGGRRMDPRFAPEQARAIFDASRAPLPPATLKSTSVSVCFRGISRLPSAFVFLR